MPSMHKNVVLLMCIVLFNGIFYPSNMMDNSVMHTHVRNGWCMRCTSGWFCVASESSRAPATDRVQFLAHSSRYTDHNKYFQSLVFMKDIVSSGRICFHHTLYLINYPRPCRPLTATPHIVIMPNLSKIWNICMECVPDAVWRSCTRYVFSPPAALGKNKGLLLVWYAIPVFETNEQVDEVSTCPSKALLSEFAIFIVHNTPWQF